MSLLFKETKYSIQCLQEPGTGKYTESSEILKYVFKMYFNIIRPFMPKSIEWPLPFSFASEILYAFLMNDVCYIAPFSHPSFLVTRKICNDEDVLLRVKEQRNILHEIRKRKTNWIGQILHRNCLLRRVTEGKIQGGLEVTGRQGRRRRKLLDDLKERRGYSHLK
jgi:hypothetical protein